MAKLNYDINDLFNTTILQAVNSPDLSGNTTSSQNTFTEGVSSGVVSDGDLISRLNVSDGYLQSGNFVSGSAGWKLDSNGDFEGNSGNFRGTIIATTGTIGGWSIGADYIKDTAGTVGLSSAVTGGDDIRFWAGHATPASAPFNVTEAGVLSAISATITGAITAGVGSSLPTDYLSGVVAQANLNLANRGWTFTGIFSATDYRVVAWTSGTFTDSAGTAYSIDAGNTGNMAALTYIYLDIAISNTILQITTTATTAIGNGKVLIAVAQNNTDTTSKASYQVFGGTGGERVFVDNISANSASTNEFISNTAQIANLVVTNAKINDLAVDKLTAGSITSKSITLAVSEGTGDSKIQAGKTDFTNIEDGFILGIDDSDSNKSKFYIGSATEYFNFDGVNVNIQAPVKITDIFTSGETINGATLPTPILIEQGTLETDLKITTSTSTSATHTDLYGAKWWGQTFTLDADTNRIDKISIYSQATDTFTATVYLYATSGGLPTGVALASKSVNFTIQGSMTWNEFTFASPVTVTPSVVYAIAVSVPDGGVGTRLDWDYNNAGGYANGQSFYSSDSGGTWNADASNDNDLKVYGGFLGTTGSIYQSDANNVNRVFFHGFAVSNSTVGNDIIVQFGGIVTGFSGLSIGENYYVSDTRGTIQTSAGSTSLKVGIALSATKLLLTNIW